MASPLLTAIGAIVQGGSSVQQHDEVDCDEDFMERFSREEIELKHARTTCA